MLHFHLGVGGFHGAHVGNRVGEHLRLGVIAKHAQRGVIHVENFARADFVQENSFTGGIENLTVISVAFLQRRRSLLMFGARA